MNAIMTISWLTFHEARRRSMVLAALILGLAFLLLFGIGFHFVTSNLDSSTGLTLRAINLNLLTIAGLYVVHFLTITLAIVISVDSISGEIASHTVQTLVTKPLYRWQIILGKWIGNSVMLVIYAAILSGGILTETWLEAGYMPDNPLQGILLIMFEAVILISLTLLGGTYMSTLTNGIVLFMLYGLAFIGSWVEQIGTLFQSQAAVQIGIISGLILPVEIIWRKAASLMQPPLLNNLSISPFGSNSQPSTAMMIYAGAYTLVMLLLAMRSFSRRDL